MHSYLAGALGGIMIGTASALLLLGRGQIMGASGILAGLFTKSEIWMERAAFVFAMIFVPFLASIIIGGATTNVTSNLGLLVFAGICVGFGTRLGSGCTSGHGVCGMSRFSIRSIVSTLIYIGAGIATIPVARLLGVMQ